MSDLKSIPGFSRYGVTSDAVVYNLVTNRKLKPHRNNRGYYVLVLVNDHGERKTVRRHRLVAITHLTLPDGGVDDYVVNHIDGIPGNDHVDNLEWCTQKKNVNHYWEDMTGKRKSTPVEVMCSNTNIVTAYESIGACARAIGINRYCIQDRLNRGSEYIWPEGYRYRLQGDVKEWPPVKDLKYGNSRKVLLLCLKTNTIYVYDKLSDILDIIGYKLSAIWKWTNDKNQPVVPGLFQIQFYDELKPWRKVNDPFQELENGSRSKIVFTFDANWNNPIWFESAKACCDFNKINPTALNYRLQSKGHNVFRDGKRYSYYSDLSEEQKKTIRYEIPLEGRVQRPSKAAIPLLGKIVTPV